jgi:DUF1365 family protein
MTKQAPQRSFIYSGKVNHRRFEQSYHSFSYSLYMMAIDIDEAEQNRLNKTWLFGTRWFKPIRFKQIDYIKGDPGLLRERIQRKLTESGIKEQPAHMTILVQCRCFGLYFSPANFVFCYNHEGICNRMLVEVSNTPWNKRHYYLVDLTNTEPTEKSFHVSPFMDLDMKYFWQVKPPSPDRKAMSVRIENQRNNGDVAFDATLALKQLPLTSTHLRRIWIRQPMMTLAVLTGIYVQAFRLFTKKIKFVTYQTKQHNPTLK